VTLLGFRAWGIALWILATSVFGADTEQPVDFVKGELSVAKEGELLVLNGQLEFSFSSEALEALENGVPLVVELRLRVRKRNAWFWEASLVDRVLPVQIRYKPLSRSYQVTDMTRGEKRSFATRGAALTALGELSRIPLLHVGELPLGRAAYEVQLRPELSIEALPLPLRPLAYISPEWNLRGKWLIHPLSP